MSQLPPPGQLPTSRSNDRHPLQPAHHPHPQAPREKYTQRQKLHGQLLIVKDSLLLANIVSLSYEDTVLLCLPKMAGQGCQRTPKGSKEPWQSGSFLGSLSVL